MGFCGDAFTVYVGKMQRRFVLDIPQSEQGSKTAAGRELLVVPGYDILKQRNEKYSSSKKAF